MIKLINSYLLLKFLILNINLVLSNLLLITNILKKFDAILQGVNDTLNRLYEFYVSPITPSSTQTNVDVQSSNVDCSYNYGVKRLKRSNTGV